MPDPNAADAAPPDVSSSVSITRDDVSHVARLARLTLTDEELDLFTGQLAAVLDHALSLIHI